MATPTRRRYWEAAQMFEGIGGWMSPNFGSVGCLGAFLFWFFIVAAVALLLYLPWSLVLNQ